MSISSAIRATLLYHSIFNYPLKKEEILNYLIQKKATQDQVNRSLSKLNKRNLIHENNGYIALKRKKSSIATRNIRAVHSEKKMKLAKYYAAILKFIPTVKLIAVTGALAVENSTGKDDIDLLIVTQKKTLWTTRFLANILLFKYKRSPNSKKQSNKACLNIFLDESSLKIIEENIYTAHELAQLKPIYSKNSTYKKLISSNKWMYDYLPNWVPQNLKLTSTKLGSFYSISILEAVLKHLQLFYMKGKITNEHISDTQLFFHPKKTQAKIIGKYHRLIEKNLS